jgi:signal transduction histidine kinase
MGMFLVRLAGVMLIWTLIITTEPGPIEEKALTMIALALFLLFYFLRGFLERREYVHWIPALVVAVAHVWILSYHHARREQHELYEQLVAEYRRLKRYASDNEQSARLDERHRIARDIHDSVGHQLTALLMQIRVALNQVEKGKNSSQLVNQLHLIKELAQEKFETNAAGCANLK